MYLPGSYLDSGTKFTDLDSSELNLDIIYS